MARQLRPEPIPWVVVVEGEETTERIPCPSQQRAERVADAYRGRFPHDTVTIEPGV